MKESACMDKKKLKNNIGFIALFCVILCLSFVFVKNESKADVEIELDKDKLDVVTFGDDFEFFYDEIENGVKTYGSSIGDKTVTYSNKYGNFSFNATKSGKVKKYEKESLTEGFLIKGTVTFKKVDITFEGSFYVDGSGRVMFYKGDMSLPEGETYSGTFYINEKCNSYKKGLYTWQDGHSYNGVFDVYQTKAGNNKSCLGNGNSYGDYYFGSEKESLHIKFNKGKPIETGTYKKNGVEYTAKYDSNGNCISTQKKS